MSFLRDRSRNISNTHIEWVVSAKSTAHVANDRDWFVTYTPLRSHIELFYGGKKWAAVVGIGDVVLSGQTHTTDGGAGSPSLFVIYNVLHVPSSEVNIYSTLLHDTKFKFSAGNPANDDRLMDFYTGETVASITGAGRCPCALLLTGQQIKATGRVPRHEQFLTAAKWAQSERVKWMESLGSYVRKEDYGQLVYVSTNPDL